MIYESVISSGDSTISGCRSDELGTNVFVSINKTAVQAGGDFYYDRSLSTGQINLKLAANGQMLLQEKPVTGAALNEVVYQISTGDFFTKLADGISDEFEKSKINFDSTTPHEPNYNVKYDITTGGIFAATGDLGQSLKTSITNKHTPFIFTDFEYFLNGQKVYSGLGVGATALDVPRFDIAGGVVTSANKNNFKYTAYKKEPRTASVTGESPDIVTGDGFIEKRTKFYINGAQEFPESYLELYSGVSMIKADSSALVSGNQILNFSTDSLNL
tara:strand:- start:1320 stop:2138 length:819 start_codon:yes stop_codon:yes gene_type:complete